MAAELDHEETARRQLALALTKNLADAFSEVFWEAYSAGHYAAGMPRLIGRRSGAKEEAAWLPKRLYSGGYALGLSQRYVFNGAHGPQYQLQVRIGSDGDASSGLSKQSTRQFEDWFRGVCLDLCRSQAIAPILKERQLADLDQVRKEDFAPWFSVSAGKMPRLASGKRRRMTSPKLSISDRIANAVASGRSSGCITCFVGSPTQPGILRALSAGHVVTHFATASTNTSVQRMTSTEPENIGLYMLPNPFPFNAGEVVVCDAALVDLMAGKEALNTFSYSGRNVSLTAALSTTEVELMAERPELGVVRQDKKVTSALFVGANARLHFLDRSDKVYTYEGLIEFGVDPSRLKNDRQVVTAGDSGALVFMRQDARDGNSVPGLGMVIGGRSAPGNLSLGYCIGLDSVLKRLGMEIIPS